jgi:quinol monooxygenase YgiN
MAKVAIHVKLTAAPGKGDDLVAAFSELYKPGGLDSEPGTEMHVIHQAKDNPDTVVFYEVYSDQDASDAHSKGEVLRSVFPKLAGLVAGAPEMIVLEPKHGHGMAV